MEENKKLDHFIRKSIKNVGLENPPTDFTDSVMSKIQSSTEVNAVFVYKPLLSKFVWLVILSIVALVFAYVILASPIVETTWFSIAQLNQMITFNVSGKIPNFEVSSISVYGISIFTLFAVLQIFMVKQRIDKHFSLE